LTLLCGRRCGGGRTEILVPGSADSPPLYPLTANGAGSITNAIKAGITGRGVGVSKTTDRFDVLRRPDQAHTGFLELFFDLVFVLAFFRLSQQMLEHLTWGGALQTLALLFAMLHVWLSTARFLDAFDPRHPLVQLLTMPIMLGTLVLAAATSQAYGRYGLLFAGIYLTIRLGGLAIVVHFLRGHEAQPSAMRILVWVGLTTVPWIAGALVPGLPRAGLWLAAGLLEYMGIGLGFPVPRLGRHGARRFELVVSAEHTAERYQQFFIIVLGEPILVTGLVFASGPFGASRSAATFVAFATTALLWRIYIHRAGSLLADAIAAGPDLRRVAVLTIYAQTLMAAGIVTIAVSDELVIAHPLGHAHTAWIAVILGGPALFLAGRATFEYAVFARVSLPRVIAVLALLALTPAVWPAPPLAAATAAAIVLAGVAVADGIRARRLPSQVPSPAG
jgi:low temperature requirement protein LtrA